MGQVEVVPQDLGRVFLNMVNNACYATDQRRRKLEEEGSSERYFPTVLVTSLRKEETAVVTIRDNGTGMPQEVIEKIFNPFFTTKPTDQGTGLGLAISNDIIRSHGGSIRVESEDGEYTLMTVELPLVTPIGAIEEVAQTEADF
jgi:two-component system NtrC family sensor kinase